MGNDIKLTLTETFGLLSDPMRVSILETLAGLQEQTCVNAIAGKVGLSLSATSHQLRKLELLGVVEKCRNGQEICYCLNKKSVLGKKLIALVRFAKRSGV